MTVQHLLAAARVKKSLRNLKKKWNPMIRQNVQQGFFPRKKSVQGKM